MAIHCAAAEHGGLIKKKKEKRKFMVKTQGPSITS